MFLSHAAEPAVRTGMAAGEELVKNLREGGCVDEHLQDQVKGLLQKLKCVMLANHYEYHNSLWHNDIHNVLPV